MFNVSDVPIVIRGVSFSVPQHKLKKILLPFAFETNPIYIWFARSCMIHVPINRKCIFFKWGDKHILKNHITPRVSNKNYIFVTSATGGKIFNIILNADMSYYIVSNIIDTRYIQQ